MASFTDEIQQFNPYIQQLPVEEYMQVGLWKQQQYDQGVQKVQGYIDSVAGLPVVGEANKRLLQDKLEQFRGKLQGVLSADFSKASLQNQIGGFAMQIARDPAIQASITAGATISAAQKSIEEAKKSGKNYSDANAAYVQAAIQEYLNASRSEAGLGYNGPTSIHSTTMDMIHEKVQKAIAPLKDAYNQNFDVNFDMQGNVMIINGDKSLDAEKIKTAVNAVLTADDYKAMGIAGWYQSMGKSDAEVVNQAAKLTNTIANYHRQFKDKYIEYAEKTEGLSEADKKRYRQLADNHQRLEQDYTKYNEQVVEKYNSGRFNREEIAGDIVRETMLNGYAGAYEFHREEKPEYSVSPYFTVQNETEKRRLEGLKLAQDAEGKRDPSGFYDTPVRVDATQSNNYVSAETMLENIDSIKKGVETGGIIKEEELKQWAADIDIDANGVRQFEYIDAGGNWVSPQAKQKAIAAAEEQWKLYKNGAFDPTFTGTIPLYNRKGMEAKNMTHVKANSAALSIRTDGYVEQEVLKKFPEYKNYKKTKHKIQDKEYSVLELMNIYERDTEERNVNTAYGLASNTDPLHAKKDSELEKLGYHKVKKILSDSGLTEKKVIAEKNKIYMDAAKAMQPMERRIIQDKSERGKAEYTAYQTIAANSDEVKSQLGVVDADKISIEGIHRNANGQIMMRVTVDGKEILLDTKTTSEDLKKSYGTSQINGRPVTDDWVLTSFYNDKAPELTAAIMRPGSGYKTVGPEKNFQGGLFVTGNPNVARHYQLVYDPDKKGIRVLVGIPLGNGKFDMVDITRTAGMKEGRTFVNAGLAMDYVNQFYSVVGDKLPVTEHENNYKTTHFK